MKHMKKFLSSFVLIFILFPLVISASDAKTHGRVIRVGWYSSALFQGGASDSEPKSGYCYEYLQKISSYNGWNYEYVYGEWADLLQALKDGKIDIMAGVSYTKERADYILYPDYVMGNETYCIYKHSDDKTMNVNDPSSFSGKKIGTIKNNRLTYYLENWIKENNLNIKVVYYDGFTERDKDFEENKIDGIIATDNNIMANSGYSYISKVGDEPYYLAVTKQKPDILNQLNKALLLVERMDPFFIYNLQYQSYGYTLRNTALTDLEKLWIEGHNTINLGYLDNYPPFCFTDKNGDASGLITDVAIAAGESLNIRKRLLLFYKKYNTYEEMIEALHKGEINVAFPVGGNGWDIEQSGVSVTTPIVTAGMNLVSKGKSFPDSEALFAVNTNNKLQYYFVKNNFSNPQFLLCNSIEECLEAVYSGAADYTIINGLRISILQNNSRYSNLSVMQLQMTEPHCLGVNRGDVGLLLLLNRTIKLIGNDYGINASYNYVDKTYQTTFEDFVRTHLIQVLFVVILIVLLIVVFLTLYIRVVNKAKVKAEAANKAKTSFLNNMSHDIRTPMNAILGYAKLMENKTEDPEVVKEYLDKIQKSGGFLLRLINNVLEVSRIDSGKLVVENDFVDLFDPDCSVAPILENEFERRNLKFTQRMDIEHRFVYTDMNKIKEISMNLLSNAIKYTPEGGSISLEFTEIPCHKKGYATYVNKISDTGVGMSPEFLDKLFDSFTRERTTTESKISGTGLGMAIVKRLVDLLNGEIQVESELGKGTTIKIIMSHKIVENPDEYLQKLQQQIHEELKFDGKRILIAEDNDFNAEIVTEILGDLGIEVERAEDGVRCFDMMNNKPVGYYDLILMDIQMQRLNGYETTDKLRKAGFDIPVVAMTANAFDEDKETAMKVGMVDYISKPIDMNNMIQVLKDILN